MASLARFAALLPGRQPFLDRILVRAGKGGEDQLARIRLPRRHRHARAVLIDLAQRVQIGKIQPRRDAVHVEIQRHGHDIQVARCARRCRRACPPPAPRRPAAPAPWRPRPVPRSLCVCTEMMALLPVLQIPAEPLDLVRVNIRHRHLHRVRQVQDHPPLRRGLPALHDRLANLQGELHLRGGKALGRILEDHVRPGQPRGVFLDPFASRAPPSARSPASPARRRSAAAPARWNCRGE